MKINAYKEMNEKIVELLWIGDRPIDLYAATRIEELEEQLNQAKVSLMKITDNVAETGEDAREMKMEAEYALSILSQEMEVKP